MTRRGARRDWCRRTAAGNPMVGSLAACPCSATDVPVDARDAAQQDPIGWPYHATCRIAVSRGTVALGVVPLDPRSREAAGHDLVPAVRRAGPRRSSLPSARSVRAAATRRRPRARPSLIRPNQGTDDRPDLWTKPALLDSVRSSATARLARGP